MIHKVSPATTELRPPHVLLVWPYHRRDYVAPFERLGGGLRLTFLANVMPSPTELCLTSHPVVYWGHFADAEEMLRSLRPDKILFMGIDSGRCIGLNAAARRRGIPTYILQHGLFSDLATYREMMTRARREPARATSPHAGKPRTSGALFMMRSFSIGDAAQAAGALTYLALARRKGHWVAADLVRMRFRYPDYYICYSPKNATIHRELDGARPEQLLYIGNPQYDAILSTLQPSSGRESSGDGSHFLLIDTALTKNSWGFTLLTVAEAHRIYLTLAEYAVSRGSKLVVKLHPDSYGADWLPQHNSIEYLEDVEVAGLIGGARGVFSFPSTLLVPAVHAKPVCVLRVVDAPLLRDLRGYGVTAQLDAKMFKLGDIRFSELSTEQRRRFGVDYLYRRDGRALERLRTILLEHADAKNGPVAESATVEGRS